MVPKPACVPKTVGARRIDPASLSAEEGVRAADRGGVACLVAKVRVGAVATHRAVVTSLSAEVGVTIGRRMTEASVSAEKGIRSAIRIMEASLGTEEGIAITRVLHSREGAEEGVVAGARVQEARIGTENVFELPLVLLFPRSYRRRNYHRPCSRCR